MAQAGSPATVMSSCAITSEAAVGSTGSSICGGNGASSGLTGAAIGGAGAWAVWAVPAGASAGLSQPASVRAAKPAAKTLGRIEFHMKVVVSRLQEGFEYHIVVAAQP